MSRPSFGAGFVAGGSRNSPAIGTGKAGMALPVSPVTPWSNSPRSAKCGSAQRLLQRRHDGAQQSALAEARRQWSASSPAMMAATAALHARRIGKIVGLGGAEARSRPGTSARTSAPAPRRRPACRPASDRAGSAAMPPASRSSPGAGKRPVRVALGVSACQAKVNIASAMAMSRRHPSPGRVALAQGQQDVDDRRHGCRRRCRPPAPAAPPACRAARAAAPAGPSLPVVDVVAGLAGARPRLAVARDRAIDEARIDRARRAS